MFRVGNIRSLIAAAFGLLLLFMPVSCKKYETDKIDAVEDRAALPGLDVKKITTVISDSGVTRYRIVTDKMEVYDKAEKPYWDFPEGLYFERFTPKLTVDANFRCDSARYLERDRLWEFNGKVKALNINGEMFETEQLFWSESERRIYSDKFIRITRKNGITSGTGFESNESMTRWKILKAKSDMYVKEDE